MPSCLLLPHGAYSLVAAVLVTMGWIAALFEDGCNYAKLSGNNVEESLPVPSDTPYVEVGLQAYRIPKYNVESGLYDPEFIGQCVQYPSDTVEYDGFWKASRAFSFAALVLGGGATFYLWISTCCRFSRPSWRWAGYEVAAACLCQGLAFVWFRTSICQKHACELFYGSRADIMAAAFWFVAALMIFGHYPAPKEPTVQDGIMNTSMSDGSLRRSSGGTSSSRQQSSSIEEQQQQTGDELSPSQELPKLERDVEMAAGEDSRQDGGKIKDLDDVVLT